MSLNVLESITIATKIAVKEKKLFVKKSLDLEVAEELSSYPNGSTCLCPFCMYTSPKHKKGSGFVKHDVFKCGACGEARRVR